MQAHVASHRERDRNMPNDFFNALRDVIVIGYLLVLRVLTPLLLILFIGKWLQVKLAHSDRREQLAHQGEPYCWDLRDTPQTRRAQAAAATHPDLPCWLAMQYDGGGVTTECYRCPRYAVQSIDDPNRVWETNGL